MYVSDYTEIGVTEDCCPPVLVDRDYVVRFADTRNMFGCSTDAKSEIELGCYCSTGETDLCLFGEPFLIGYISCGPDCRVEHGGELIDPGIIFWFAHTHADTQDNLCRILALPHLHHGIDAQ